MNSVLIVGTLVGRVTYHCTPEGQDLVRFTVREPNERPQTTGDQSYTVHSCTAWGPLALRIHANSSPGQPVAIRARLSYRNRYPAGVQHRQTLVPYLTVASYSVLGRSTVPTAMLKHPLAAAV